MSRDLDGAMREARRDETVGVDSMTVRGHASVTLEALDVETAALVRLEELQQLVKLPIIYII